jgi:hypothetical protein
MIDNDKGFQTANNSVSNKDTKNSDLTKDGTTRPNQGDRTSVDFSDSNGTNPLNQFVSQLNSQFDSVKTSFDVMCLKENFSRETLQ